MIKKDIKFNKYQKRGAYHWQQISLSIFNYNAFVSARYNQVVDEVFGTKKSKILDIGCGEGVLIYLMFKKTKSAITGIDTDQLSLDFAKNKLKSLKVKAKLKTASAYKLPFKNNAFDLVVSAEVVEHLTDIKKYLTQIKKVLKPNGQLIITTPVKLGSIPEDKMHVKEFTPKELKVLLSRYFDKVTIKTSHPLWLKKLYLFRLFKFNRFYFEPFRLLINFFVLLTNLNPFKLELSQPTNQIAICQKPL